MTRIGPTQRHVLLVLSVRGPSAANDWAAWFPLDNGQCRAALNRLAWRGLVDAVGWEDGARGGRLYGLTRAGLEAVAEIVGEGDPEELLEDA